MSGLSQSVDDILEGLRQPEWRVPLDMTQSKALADEVARLTADLAAARADRDKLKQRLRDIHQWRCTADNCNLDGGEEHEEYFASGGLSFADQLKSREVKN